MVIRNISQAKAELPWLWPKLVSQWLSVAPALPQDAREVIANPENTCVRERAVTMWEIWLKVGLDRLRPPTEF